MKEYTFSLRWVKKVLEISNKDIVAISVKKVEVSGILENRLDFLIYRVFNRLVKNERG
jgi:ribosomal protein S4